ncbi:hypothetical protein B0H16DRAFT_1311677 [Mycena metata]|uniref:Uncharacterized protein n=1 Tax=Mycena metata TaxID=1033252 RepID=A0AAD7JDA4_9AGAR|nr:hypothetical protein B0H16DRAFT_1312602 [Mycena metata]KAJ7762451.1 hypothetical protein B0H16DRAFT_1311677 [Mycena metata]
MGSDFCSAPGIPHHNAKRSFSVGRRKLGCMQHNTAKQTFHSSMAIGSRDDTPLFPDLNPAIKILEQAMERGWHDDD